MSLPAYPEYRRSGIDWIPDVPAHWDVCHLKRIASLRSGESITAEMIEPEGLYPVYGGNGLRGYTDDFTHEGRFALVGRQGALCGNVNYAEGKFWASEHAVVATPLASTQTAWLGELLRAMDLNQYSVSAAQPGLSVEAISNLRVPVPPRDEQVSIAMFLARETAKIDALIAEQEKLLALLAEMRQAAISHAVTRGLDPNAPMKDSGIPWLGDVPAHWWVGPLRRIVNRVDTGGTPSNDPPSESIECGVPWITPGDFTGDLDLKSASKAVSVQQVQKGEAKCFPADAIFIVGIGATLGKVGLFGSPASANQQINAVTMQGAHVSRFFAYSLSAKVEVMRYLSNASTIGIMNQSKTKDIYIAVPPRTEQIEIASYLDGAMSRFSILEIQVRDAITLLEERRIALIAAAVTGQIDVRGVVEPEAA